MAHINTLPPEILRLIVGELPGIQQFRCRGVCRRWRRALPTVPVAPRWDPQQYLRCLMQGSGAQYYRYMAFNAWLRGIYMWSRRGQFEHLIDTEYREERNSEAAAEDVEWAAEEVGIRDVYKAARNHRAGRRAELLYKHCGIRQRGTLHAYFK